MFQRRKVPGGSAPFFKVPVSVTAGAGIFFSPGIPLFPSLTLSPLIPKIYRLGKNVVIKTHVLFPVGKYIFPQSSERNVKNYEHRN